VSRPREFCAIRAIACKQGSFFCFSGLFDCSLIREKAGLVLTGSRFTRADPSSLGKETRLARRDSSAAAASPGRWSRVLPRALGSASAGSGGHWLWAAAPKSLQDGSAAAASSAPWRPLRAGAGLAVVSLGRGLLGAGYVLVWFAGCLSPARCPRLGRPGLRQSLLCSWVLIRVDEDVVLSLAASPARPSCPRGVHAAGTASLRLCSSSLLPRDWGWLAQLFVAVLPFPSRGKSQPVLGPYWDLRAFGVSTCNLLSLLRSALSCGSAGAEEFLPQLMGVRRWVPDAFELILSL